MSAEKRKAEGVRKAAETKAAETKAEGTSALEETREEPRRTAGTPPRGSRRFPVFTRDTARPEGGGRAAPGDAPAPARQWPLLGVLTGVAVGLLVTLGDFRTGILIIGASVLAGAVLRWAVPSVGILAVRSRFTDVLTYGVLGTAIVLLAMMAQPKPWLELPLLEEIVHFSIR